MRIRSVCSIGLALMFLHLAATSAWAAKPELESSARILVTFENGQAGKLVNTLVPGKYYRYRARYRVSGVIRRHARALASDYDMTMVEDWPIESLGVFCVVYALAPSTSPAQLLEKLELDPRVESAQEMHQFKSMALPSKQYNDSYAGYQYALESMGVSQAHKYANGKNVSIAVIDSGVDLKHEEFRVSAIHSHDFVAASNEQSSMAHGTAVVSVIVASPNNGKGIVGVAPAAEVTSLRACWTDGDSETARCDSLTLAKALDHVVRSPPHLINLSISGPEDALLGRLIDKALENGTVIVAARAPSAGGKTAYPAGHAGVLAIGVAQTPQEFDGERTARTGALLAPGEQIMVALPDNDYDFRSGSSLAAANASGVVALLLERLPNLDGARIADILQKSQAGAAAGIEMINACRALAEIDIAETCL